MAHETLRIVDGVNQLRTPALNEAGLSQSQLIRYFPNSRGDEMLVAKLGGWSRFYGASLPSIARALWAFADTDGDLFLAAGCENATGTSQSLLGVINNGSLRDLTPRADFDNITAAISSTSGSAILTITDATIQNITAYDTVYIATQIAIGGVVLFGLYACNPDGHLSATTYTVQAKDVLGNPLAATGSSSSPVLPEFATTSGSSSVTVTLPNHGYSAGDLFPVLVPTTVGGVTFSGHFPVQSVTSSSVFTITGTQQANATTTGFLNGNKARYVYSFGVGSIPAGTGFGVGGFGRGGFGSGTAIVPSLGFAVSADDWTMGNWGEILIACPSEADVILPTTSTSGTGTTGTVSFANNTFTTPVGTGVVVANVSPATWNGTYTVTGSTSHSVSFATSVTSAMSGAGTVTVQTTDFSPIYQWDSESGSPFATVISNGPPVNEGMFIAMPQRQIIAYGSTFTGIQDPLLVRWCDINNYNVWIGTPANQAGSFRIPRGSRLVGGMQGPQQGILWTDIGVWVMQYINQPLVYSFNEVGTGCGLIAKKAAATLNNDVYWMGPSQFFSLTDAGVNVVPCDVWDVVFQDLDANNLSKIRSAVNSRFGEITWYYPSASGGTGEVDSYVKMTLILGRIAWDYGKLARSAWIDQSVFEFPIAADPATLLIFEHETSPDADGQAMAPSFRTGYFTVSDGDYLTFLDQWWPDFKYGTFNGPQSASVQITFYAANYPEETPRVFGPYTVNSGTKWLTPRIRSRLLAMDVSSDDVGSWWMIGANRYRAIADGKF